MRVLNHECNWTYISITTIFIFYCTLKNFLDKYMRERERERDFKDELENNISKSILILSYSKFLKFLLKILIQEFFNSNIIFILFWKIEETRTKTKLDISQKITFRFIRWDFHPLRERNNGDSLLPQRWCHNDRPLDEVKHSGANCTNDYDPSIVLT